MRKAITGFCNQHRMMQKWALLLSTIWIPEHRNCEDWIVCVCACSIMSDSLQTHGSAWPPAPLCMEFSKEYWSRLPSSPGIFPVQGWKLHLPASSALAGGFFTMAPPGKSISYFKSISIVEDLLGRTAQFLCFGIYLTGTWLLFPMCYRLMFASTPQFMCWSLNPLVWPYLQLGPLRR